MKWGSRAAVVISIALAVGGCGSSSTKTKASTGSTPAASSTPAGTATTSDSGHISKSARVASAAFYDFAVRVTNSSAPYLSASQAKFAAHCIQHRFLAAGFKTEGDVQRATDGQRVRDILTMCFLKGRYH